MADGTVSPQAPTKGRPYKHTYTPPDRIAGHPGLKTRLGSEPQEDFYTGTKADLIAAGFPLEGFFPGDPGMPLGSVMVWPHGSQRGGDWFVPGRAHINRLSSGKFTVSFVVSRDEQQRRRDILHAAAEERNKRFEDERRLELAEKRAGESLANIIRQLGINKVAAHVRQLERQSRPVRHAGHLRLVWSRPVL